MWPVNRSSTPTAQGLNSQVWFIPVSEQTAHFTRHILSTDGHITHDVSHVKLHPRKLGCGPTANTQHNSSDSIPPYIFFPLADCPCRQLMRLIPLSSRRAAPSKLSFIIANQRPVRFPFMSKLCEPPKDWRLQNMEAWNMAAQSWTLKGVFKCMLNPESFKGFEAEWCGVFRSPRFWPSPGEGNK